MAETTSLSPDGGPDIRAGRRDAAGIRRGRSPTLRRASRRTQALVEAERCLYLLRRALRRGLPDRHRHPAASSAASRPATCAARPRPSSRPTSWAACAPASARPRCCASRPACARRRGQAGRDRPAAALRDRRADRGRPSSSSTRGAPTGKRIAVVGAGPGRPGLRPRARHARPRGHVFEARDQARRPQRIRPGDLQDGRTTSPQAEVDCVLRDRRHRRSSTAGASAATSRSPTLRATTTRSSSASAWRRQRARRSRARTSPASRTRSTSSPSCARRRTRRRCRSAGASSSSAAA